MYISKQKSIGDFFKNGIGCLYMENTKWQSTHQILFFLFFKFWKIWNNPKPDWEIMVTINSEIRDFFFKKNKFSNID